MSRLFIVITIIISLTAPAMAMENGSEPQQLTYPSEVALSAAGWAAGTFDSCQASFKQHFLFHHTDRGIRATSPLDYLRLAIQTYQDTTKNLHHYKITYPPQRPGYEPVCKYTHTDTKRFIIIGDKNGKIYSFGGHHRGGKKRTKR